MNRLIKTTTIRVGFAWTDWELYDKPGVTLIAQKLNTILQAAVNDGGDRRDVAQTMFCEFKRFRDFGADDSEPHRFLERILNDIFGEE